MTPDEYNDYIHNLFIDTVIKAKDNPVSDHTHTFMTHGNTNWSPNYGQHTHTLGINDLAPHWDQMRRQIEASIFEQRILTNRLNQQAKDKPMSTLDKIKAERREKREREELEAKYDRWEQTLGLSGEGDVVTFTWTAAFENEIKRYAAIYTDKQWRTTDGYTFDTEGFIAKLIERNIEPADLAHMEPIE